MCVSVYNIKEISVQRRSIQVYNCFSQKLLVRSSALNNIDKNNNVDEKMFKIISAGMTLCGIIFGMKNFVQESNTGYKTDTAYRMIFPITALYARCSIKRLKVMKPETIHLERSARYTCLDRSLLSQSFSAFCSSLPVWLGKKGVRASCMSKRLTQFAAAILFAYFETLAEKDSRWWTKDAQISVITRDREQMQFF